jgi:hypothetical protein
MTTKVVKIKGKILDEEGKAIPSAFVYLSDSKGNVVQDIRTRANLQGEYSLPFSIPVPSIATGKINFVPISKYITFRTLGYPIKTVSFPESIINSSKSEEVFDVQMTPKTIQTGEVVISAKEQCEQEGKIWDDINKKCNMASKKTENTDKNWWNKNKWFVIGGLLLAATVTTILVIKKK